MYGRPELGMLCAWYSVCGLGVVAPGVSSVN